jgi:hypothetical protein
MAKMFLHSQKPTDKYKFFLKGTQLAQLMEDYEKLSEQIETIKSILAIKGERVKELKDAQKQASQAWQEIEATKNVETQITKLKNELAWVQVVEIEQAMENAVKNQITQQGKVNKYEDSITKLKQDLEAAKAAVQAAETNREELDNSAADEEMAALKKKIDDANARTRAVKVSAVIAGSPWRNGAEMPRCYTSERTTSNDRRPREIGRTSSQVQRGNGSSTQTHGFQHAREARARPSET